MLGFIRTGVFVKICSFFFFQAEDGIRDWSVTGVQTCALPISPNPYGQIIIVNKIYYSYLHVKSGAVCPQAEKWVKT